MRSSKKWLTLLAGAVMCLMLAAAVKQEVRAEEEMAGEDYLVCLKDTKLYKVPDWTAGEIAASVPKDGVLIERGVEGSYTKVEYQGVEGYIDTLFVGYDQKVIDAYEAELAAKREAERIAAELEAQRIAAELEAQRIAAELEAQRIAAELEAQRLALELLAKSEEIRMMAAMIECEAGNQPFEGQVAVGAVIMNRVKAAIYPNTIPEVLFQPSQFGPADGERFAGLLANDTIKESCREAALQAYLGADPVNGAMHFRRVGKKEGIVIGDHVFW